MVSEKGSNGNASTYIRGDRVLVKKDQTASKDYYYLFNGHGDVVQMVDTSGTIVNSYGYDEWGNIAKQQETVANSFKYAGEAYDSETGLYYLKARYYDPSQGRFLNEDSYEGQITNPLTLNIYGYATNSPLRYTDPSGHMRHDLLNKFLSDFIQGKNNGSKYTEDELANATFNANGNNTSGRYKAMHEIAQIHAAKAIAAASGKSVQLEYHIVEQISFWPDSHYYVDIVSSDNSMWEVKAMRVTQIGVGDGGAEDAEAQLDKYQQVDNDLKRGYQVEDIEGVDIVDDLKMDIEFYDKGKVRYSFYLDYGDKGKMPLTTKMAESYVAGSSVYPPTLPDIQLGPKRRK